MVLCQVNDAQCHFGEDGMRRFHPLVFFAAKAALDHVARDNRSAVAARPRADDGDGTAGHFQPTRHPGRTGHVERMFCPERRKTKIDIGEIEFVPNSNLGGLQLSLARNVLRNGIDHRRIHPELKPRQEERILTAEELQRTSQTRRDKM